MSNHFHLLCKRYLLKHATVVINYNVGSMHVIYAATIRKTCIQNYTTSLRLATCTEYYMAIVLQFWKCQNLMTCIHNIIPKLPPSKLRIMFHFRKRVSYTYNPVSALIVDTLNVSAQVWDRLVWELEDIMMQNVYLRSEYHLDAGGYNLDTAGWL